MSEIEPAHRRLRDGPSKSQDDSCAGTVQAVFEELEKLCVSPGYIQSLASICFKDNLVRFADELSGQSLLKLHSWDRLIRTEIMTLVALMVKEPIDFTLQEAATTQKYVEETDRLMKALHNAISGPVFNQFTPDSLKQPWFDPSGSGSVLREPIFYSGEAAYTFQLRDFAVPKYAADNAWLKQHKGFSIDEARSVAQAFVEAQKQHLATLLESLQERHPSECSFVDGFSATLLEIAHLAGCDVLVVRNVLSAFALPAGDRNSQFQSLDDFNVCTATPILKRGSDSFVLLSHHSLMQSLYESPFYWMAEDPHYKDTASANRGQFAERFVSRRLVHVFGDKRVLQGVKVLGSKGNELTDIDVLALFGNRAIVVQAKSKKLTLEARNGDGGRIRADFKRAVQDAYDQGYEAASALLNPAYKFRDSTGQPLQTQKLKEVFIITVLSEAYPALAFQARQFLRLQSTQTIRPPIVADVFSIDAMTEMLDSPIWLIDYLRRRSGYSEKLHVPDELTALSFHLKQNLWLEDQYDIVQLTDDISCDLDAAMAVRREGLPGRRTPDGILTKFAGMTIERILRQIEERPEPDTLEFAFRVLSCDEETVKKLSEGIDKAGALFDHDGRPHNFVMSIRSVPVIGIIVHCNRDAVDVALNNLRTHCEDRKYIHKAENWLGICVDPRSKKLRLGISLEFPWKQSAAMDRRASAIQTPAPPKVGRNDLCPRQW